ncbi:hypothetical protein [Streptomyces jumonjinensis]
MDRNVITECRCPGPLDDEIDRQTEDDDARGYEPEPENVLTTPPGGALWR